ncbi:MULTISPECIES: M23 family metallopeptidase [unclassified Dysgonomonas]|uniref:M23 family metallopeptidase n=1 Tax=unclassified Dysgonomonas TaxID=2630389 RepID=UPI0024770599|nr:MULTISPECIES: M23 family metallopeptidase [unclassified Dysgonomonas]
MLVKILEESKNFNDIELIIPVLRKYPSIYNSLPLGVPIKEKYRISSLYGNRLHPIHKIMKLHSGIDFVSDYATTIHATANGTVTYAGNKGGYGKCVVIEHDYGYSTLYAHLTLYYTKKGKKVSKGDVIGFLGSTGNSTGDHLHYEIRKHTYTINPKQWLN